MESLTDMNKELKMKPNAWKHMLWAGLAGMLLTVLASGCAHRAHHPETETETRILLDFFESQRDYLHDGGSFIITAQDLRMNLLTRPDSQYLIDIRPPEDFAKGHIKGAVRVPFGDVYNHVQSLDATAFENIVLINCDGQATAYLTSLLRAAGYPGTVSLKWGMSAWSHVFAKDAWLRQLGSTRTQEFVHTASPPKNEPGPLPRLNTGTTDPEAILQARLQRLFAEGFAPVWVDHASVFHGLYENGSYYVINYWAPELYLQQGHIPGAVNYPPASQPFRSGNDLSTLSTTVPNVLYCFTGQTSAYISGYLRLLGYDSRSLMFGANTMIYDRMVENRVPNTFLPDTEILNYDYVAGR